MMLGDPHDAHTLSWAGAQWLSVWALELELARLAHCFPSSWPYTSPIFLVSKTWIMKAT